MAGATTVDMDSLIVRQQQMSIAEIFARIQET
jgi:shikimate kinase